jgi:hypothetical protein
LFLLSLYQAIEATICVGLLDSTVLSRLAFMVIIWLPPFGVLLISKLFAERYRLFDWFIIFLFTINLLTVILILFDKNFVLKTVCSTVFAKFTNSQPLYLFYSIVYQFGLLSMILTASYGIITYKNSKEKLLMKQILIGTLAFVIPALITVFAVRSTNGALPSIMCHFAIFLALFLFRMIYLDQKVQENFGQ